MPRRHLLLLLAPLVSSGCTLSSDIGGPCGAPRSLSSGTSPCREQFYYPTGIAIDPDGDVAYVTNGNADLRYSGGTVASIDLRYFECALQVVAHGYPADLSTLPECAGYEARVGDAVLGVHRFVDPTVNDTVAVANHWPPGSGCRPALLDPSITECDEQPFIADAVRVGNFAGSIRVQKLGARAACNSAAGRSAAPADTGMRRLFVPVRGDPSVTFVDVRKAPPGTAAAAQPLCDGATPQTGTRAGLACLDCPDVLGDPLHVPNGCDPQRITVRDFATPTANPGAQCSLDSTTCANLPPDPFGISLDEGCTPEGANYSHLLVAHLSGGEMTLIDADPTKQPISMTGTPSDPSHVVVRDIRGGFFPLDAAGRGGAFSVTPRVPGDPTGYWYATSRLNPTVAMFRVADVDLLLPIGSFAVSLGNGPYATGADVRDLVFDSCTAANPACTAPRADGTPGAAAPGSAASPDNCCLGVNQPCSGDGDCCSLACANGHCTAGAQGCRAFAVEEQPPSLFTIDTRVEPERFPAGVPRNQVVDVVNICQGVSHLRMTQSFEGVAPGGRPRTLLYAVCFNSGQVAVVDPDLARLVDNILVGSGPSEIAFNFGPGMPEPAHRRAYVTEFLDMNLSVIDLDPSSPRYHRVIGRIGISQPPPAGT
jgi:hypothetical protein